MPSIEIPKERLISDIIVAEEFFGSSPYSMFCDLEGSIKVLMRSKYINDNDFFEILDLAELGRYQDSKKRLPHDKNYNIREAAHKLVSSGEISTEGHEWLNPETEQLEDITINLV